MQDERTRLISPCLKAGVLRRDLIKKRGNGYGRRESLDRKRQCRHISGNRLLLLQSHI